MSDTVVHLVSIDPYACCDVLARSQGNFSQPYAVALTTRLGNTRPLRLVSSSGGFKGAFPYLPSSRSAWPRCSPQYELTLGLWSPQNETGTKVYIHSVNSWHYGVVIKVAYSNNLLFCLVLLLISEYSVDNGPAFFRGVHFGGFFQHQPPPTIRPAGCRAHLIVFLDI